MTDPIHDAAARGFERGAGDYEKGRPGYPPEALETLTRETGLGPGKVVVDVGAGTGKFTRLLVSSGARVIAVEPVAAMRAQLSEAVPEAEVHEGTAERIPQPDASVDVVTAAQAFHWFDHRKSLAEVARVVRPGGWLALVWNTRDPGAAWTATIEAVLARHRGDAPFFRSHDPTWRGPIAESPDFAKLQSATFVHRVAMDLDLMVARVASTSYISALPDDEREAVLDEVAALVRRDLASEVGAGFVESYLTEVFWCRRR